MIAILLKVLFMLSLTYRTSGFRLSSLTSSIRSKLTRSMSVDTELDGLLEVPVEKALKWQDNITFVDGTWWMPNSRDYKAREAFEKGPRIPGAVYIDIDDLADKSSDLPHMMPPADLWSRYLTKYDIISADQHVVVYSQETSCLCIHRAFVQCLSMGHNPNKLHLLQGSLEDWKEAGGSVVSSPVQVLYADDLTGEDETNYPATEAQAMIDMETLRKAIDDNTCIILDARAEDRFLGKVPEPRAGLRRGHMPGAQHLFFQSLLKDDAAVCLKSKEELESILDTFPKSDKQVVVSCGSGVTACTIKVAMMATGTDPNSILLYDGSWTEWGSTSETPVDGEVLDE